MNIKNKKGRRLSRRDLAQMDKIETLLESVTTSTQPASNPIITPITQTIQKPITTIIPTPRAEYYLPHPFNGIKASELSMSNHAYQRSLERLKLQRTSENEIAKFLRSKLSKSEYIGQITCTDGTDGEAFIWNDICIMLTTNLTTIKTIWVVERMPFSPVISKIKSLMEKEFRKLDRREKSRIRKLELYTYEIEAEVAELKLKIFKTRSEAVKLASKGRIAGLEVSLQEWKNEILQIKTDKRQVAKSLMSVI